MRTPVDEATTSVASRLQYHVTEWFAGRPVARRNNGGSMRDSHQHLNIQPKEWDAFMMTCNRRSTIQVPCAEQAELRAIVQSTYGDIVIGQ